MRLHEFDMEKAHHRLGMEKICKTAKAHVCGKCGEKIHKGTYALTVVESVSLTPTRSVRTVATHRLCPQCTSEAIALHAKLTVAKCIREAEETQRYQDSKKLYELLEKLGYRLDTIAVDAVSRGYREYIEKGTKDE